MDVANDPEGNIYQLGRSRRGRARDRSLIKTWRIPSDAALTWDFHVELLTCVNVGLFGLNVDFPR